MTIKVPNEVLLNISSLAGQESSLDLEPLTRINRQWHTVVAPSLLSRIAVSSLGSLLNLCGHLESLKKCTGDTLPSFIPNNAQTIVISGEIWPARADCHVGLEDLGEIGRGDDEDEDDPAEPDVLLPFDEVSSKLHAGLSLLVVLDSLEWYGRFAGDYHLVRYLQKAEVIRHLAYGIDLQVSMVSLAYRENAFQFEGLKTLKVTTEYEPEYEMFPMVVDLMHRNHELEEILFDCKYSESMSGRWSLNDVICKDQKTFIWPNLKSLVLSFFKGEFWQASEEVEALVNFLVAHPHLETLVLRETCLEDSESDTALPLTLSAHLYSLPALKLLIGSPRLIAGVLESPAACSSVTTIVDNSEVGFDAEGAKAPYIDRIINSLESAPGNLVQRIGLEVPQLNHTLYTKFAKVAPNVRFIEFFRDKYRGAKSTSQDPNFNALNDIPACLEAFPNLEIVGRHIAADFCDALGEGQGGEAALIELARRVPHLNAVYCDQGTFLMIARGSDGIPSVSKEPIYLDYLDFRWVTFDVDWQHRPISRRKVSEVRQSNDGNFESLARQFGK